jgi:hypothetical protein
MVLLERRFKREYLIHNDSSVREEVQKGYLIHSDSSVREEV